MMFKKSFATLCIAECFLLSPIFLTSCGKKKAPAAPNVITYGPLSIVNGPDRPSVLVHSCVPGEFVTCDLQYEYFSDFTTHIESRGFFCPASRTLTFVFTLDDCHPSKFTGWAGRTSCTSTQSNLTTTQPLTINNVQCV